jgi:hypothetical protein
MNTSPTSYHIQQMVRALPGEFIGIETSDLIHDISCFTDLYDAITESDDPESTRSSSLAYLEQFLDRAVTEVERRKAAEKRNHGKARWRLNSRYDDMKDLAQELKGRLSIAGYLDRYVPWTILHPTGDRLRGRCPFPNHQDGTASFVVFPDDHAWCFGCQQGGDLFRVVALIEGIPVFRDQLRFVADLVEPGAQGVG